MKRSAGIALLLLFAASLTLVVRAPAAWLGDWLQARSKIRLVDARGTLWHGSALVGLSDGRATTLVPERVAWRIDFFPRPALELSHPWLTAPLRISMEPEALAFQQGKAILPAGVLASAGAPFNTLKPGGVLEVAWSDARLRGAAGARAAHRRGRRRGERPDARLAQRGARHLRKGRVARVLHDGDAAALADRPQARCSVAHRPGQHHADHAAATAGRARAMDVVPAVKKTPSVA